MGNVQVCWRACSLTWKSPPSSPRRASRAGRAWPTSPTRGSQGGRPDASLRFYDEAASQARTAAKVGGEQARQAWSDLAAITGNWAHALRHTGDLDASRQRQLESAEALRQAGRPGLRHRHRAGSPAHRHHAGAGRGGVAASGRATGASGGLVAAASLRPVRARGPPSRVPRPHAYRRLDIAKDADRALNDWESALGRNDAVLEVKRGLHRPAEDIAVTRMNRAAALGRLGRFGEAKAELEECLQVFQNDHAMRAKVLSSLAELFNKQGDVPQAIVQQRRALALFEQLPDPSDRAMSHNNLAIYLEGSGTPSALAESSRHRLAALVYVLVSGLGGTSRTRCTTTRSSSAAPTPPAPPWPCLAWPNSSPTPPSTH